MFWNLTIPKAVRHLYDGRKRLVATMGTDSVRRADELVAAQKAKFAAQIEQGDERAAKISKRDNLIAALDPGDRRLLDAAGGIEGLASAIKDLPSTVAFLTAVAGGDPESLVDPSPPPLVGFVAQRA